MKKNITTSEVLNLGRTCANIERNGVVMEDRCPLCLQIKQFDIENVSYLKFQNTERLVCKQCAAEIRGQMRPTWQIISGRVFPRSTKSF